MTSSKTFRRNVEIGLSRNPLRRSFVTGEVSVRTQPETPFLWWVNDGSLSWIGNEESVLTLNLRNYI